MTTQNIRNKSDRAAIIAKGYRCVTVAPRGENKGMILSRHKTRDAAENAARNKDRHILDADCNSF